MLTIILLLKMIMIVELNFQSNEHFDLHHNFLQYQHNHWTHHLYVGECWNVFNYKALTSRPHCLTQSGKAIRFIFLAKKSI